MITEPDLKQLSGEELQKRHTGIYKDFLPTLTTYTQMASDLVALQIEMFTRRLADQFPKAMRFNNPHILTISARETPAKFDQMLESLRQQNLVPGLIVYDPVHHSFSIFAQTPE